MRNYLCGKCKALISTNNNAPEFAECPKGGLHRWNDLGEVGTHNYQCKRCGTSVKSKDTPNMYNCPSGSLHDWKYLN
jgi:DNA-directed RNA polymerase subunit RPC12/RpoP